MKQEFELGNLDICAEVIDPKIIIRNNIFPPTDELRNCTTCIKGRQLPADKLSTEDYHYYCKWDLKTHIGQKCLDNACENYIRKRREKT